MNDFNNKNIKNISEPKTDLNKNNHNNHSNNHDDHNYDTTEESNVIWSKTKIFLGYLFNTLKGVSLFFNICWTILLILSLTGLMYSFKEGAAKTVIDKFADITNNGGYNSKGTELIKLTEKEIEKQKPLEWTNDILNETVKKEVKNFLFNKHLSLKSSNSLAIESHLLLYGPPGSGKSYLANEIVKNESFAYGKLNLSVVVYVGSNLFKIEKVKKETMELVEENKKKDKFLIIILDEIDSFGKSRENNSSDGRSHKDEETNALLTFIDWVNEHYKNVFFIGITNMKDSLDSALIRQGRMGTHIFVDYMNAEEKVKALQNIREKHRKLTSLVNVLQDDAWEELYKIMGGKTKDHELDFFSKLDLTYLDLESTIQQLVSEIVRKKYTSEEIFENAESNFFNLRINTSNFINLFAEKIKNIDSNKATDTKFNFYKNKDKLKDKQGVGSRFFEFFQNPSTAYQNISNYILKSEELGDISETDRQNMVKMFEYFVTKTFY